MFENALLVIKDSIIPFPSLAARFLLI